MPSNPRLIVIGGFAGAGKSTLVRSVGRALGITYYEIDLVARTIANSRDFHGSNAKGVAFDLFWTLARAYLENGNSLVFDQNMGQPWQWGQIERVAAGVPGAEVVTFILDCPWDLCLERVEARSKHPDWSKCTVENIHRHKHKWDYVTDNEFPGAIRIDASRSQGEVFADVMSHLDPAHPHS